MAKQLLPRRGNTAEHAAFTGAFDEITVDTEKHVLVVHDGVTKGGWPQANAVLVTAQLAVINSNLGVRTSAIGTLQSNAASQAVAINGLTSNLAVQTVRIDALATSTNATFINNSFTDVRANLLAAHANLALLYGNATVQSEAITLVNANITALRSSITAANSAIAGIVTGTAFVTQTAFANNLTAVNSAVSTQGTTFATNVAVAGIRANVTAANVAISALQASITAANVAIDNIALSPSLVNSIANQVGPIVTGGVFYSNAKVASYLAHYDSVINFTSSTAIISNVGVITVGDHIQSPAYQFSNGVNILSAVASLTNGASNVSISTANGVPTIARAPYFIGPGSYPARTWTFGSGPIGSALAIPGLVQGPSQTGLISADNYGLVIDSANTPASISLGLQDGNANLTKFFWGSGSKNGIAGDVEIQTIPVSSTPTSIILSPQGGQNGSFIFGGTGNLTLPAGGALNTANATASVSLFGGATTGTISIGSGLTTGGINIGTSNNNPQIAIGGGGSTVSIIGLSLVGPADKMWTTNYSSGTLQRSTFNSRTGTAVSGGQSYSGVTQLSTSGTGTGAQWQIVRSGGAYTSVIIYSFTYGYGYAVGDTVTIAGASLGGTTPANNLTFTIGNVVDNTYPAGTIGMIIYDSVINHFLGYVNNAWVQIDSPYTNSNVSSYLSSNSSTNISTTGNLYVGGNITQQSAYYETYSNVTNSGGNLTCNFVNGTTFYATLTANVTVNFTNVVATTGRVTGATLIVDQGATAYRVANIQINSGGIQTIKYAGGTPNTGTVSNTDVMSFSLISLDGTNWRVLGQISNYG